jgi:hypothetical protein
MVVTNNWWIHINESLCWRVPNLSRVLVVRNLNSLIINNLHGGILNSNNKSAIDVFYHRAVKECSIVDFTLTPVLSIEASVFVGHTINHLGILIIICHLGFK